MMITQEPYTLEKPVAEYAAAFKAQNPSAFAEISAGNFASPMAMAFRTSCPDVAAFISSGKANAIAPTAAPTPSPVAAPAARHLSPAEEASAWGDAMRKIRILDSNVRSAEEHRARILGEGEPANTRCYRDGRAFGSGAGHEIAATAIAAQIALLNGTPVPTSAPVTSTRPRSERREVSMQRAGISSLQAQIERANGRRSAATTPVALAYREPHKPTSQELGIRSLQAKIDRANGH